jgi:hypothetical protein
LNSGPPAVNLHTGELNPHGPAVFGARPSQGLTALAGLPVTGPLVQPEASWLPPSGTTRGVSGFPGGTVSTPPAVGAVSRQSSQVETVGASTAGTEETAQASAGMTMMPPAMAGRPSPTAGRTVPRPAGRAALWYSQRRQKRDSKDPWSVRKGVPPVIEAPPEPTDHDPGPGVIGIDA